MTEQDWIAEGLCPQHEAGILRCLCITIAEARAASKAYWASVPPGRDPNKLDHEPIMGDYEPPERPAGPGNKGGLP